MGTPVPRRAAEEQTQNNECKVYHWTPEQIAAMPAAKPIPRSQSKPLAVGVMKDSDKRKIRGFGQNKMNIERDDYLALRAVGKTKAECVKELGVTQNSLKSYWMKKWRLTGHGVEGQAIAEYIESQRT